MLLHAPIAGPVLLGEPALPMLGPGETTAAALELPIGADHPAELSVLRAHCRIRSGNVASTQLLSAAGAASAS